MNDADVCIIVHCKSMVCVFWRPRSPGSRTISETHGLGHIHSPVAPRRHSQ